METGIPTIPTMNSGLSLTYYYGDLSCTATCTLIANSGYNSSTAYYSKDTGQTWTNIPTPNIASGSDKTISQLSYKNGFYYFYATTENNVLMQPQSPRSLVSANVFRRGDSKIVVPVGPINLTFGQGNGRIIKNSSL
jgi:hypothetical protein